MCFVKALFFGLPFLKHGDVKGLSMAVASAPWTLALSMLLQSSGSRLPKSANVAFNSGISTCKASRWPFASELLDTMSRCMLRLDSFSFHAAAGLSQNSKWMVQYDIWAFSLSLLEMMNQMLVEQDLITQGVNMSVLAGSKLWEQGQLLLDVMHAQRVLPDLLVCSSAISACSTGGWMRALEVRAALADSAVDRITCCALMDVCAGGAGGAWVMGLQVYSTMLRQKLQLDARSCSAALQCNGSGMAWCSAQEILRQMLALSFNENEIGVDTLIRCYKKAIDPWPLALDLLKPNYTWSFPLRDCKSGAVAACEAASVPCVFRQLS